MAHARIQSSFRVLLSFGGVAFLASGVRAAQGGPDYEQPPIRYSASTPQDAIMRLEQRIASGQLKLGGTDLDILLGLLRELEIPTASQVVVFSKTSLQRGRIQPKHPRAIYFSDSVYVGWVPGGLIEVASIDPLLGPIFYSFNPQAARKAGARFERDSDCLRCHGDMFVRGIPAVFARSVFPTETGEMLLRHGSTVVDDQTPFEQRWGGWYVTGYTGALNHRGNEFASEQDDRLIFVPTAKRPSTLREYFDTSEYPAGTSDVVALLVIEHQMAVQNSLTRAGFSARRMLAYQKGLQTTFKEPITEEPAYDSVKSVFASAVDDVVDHLLFRKEAPLPDAVGGGAAFREAFASRAVRTAEGHSLRDLRLRERMFEHRCSYMIYSDSFASLPASLKTRILTRLQEVLLGRDKSDRYSYLSVEERQKILAILRETHPDAKRLW